MMFYLFCVVAVVSMLSILVFKANEVRQLEGSTSNIVPEAFEPHDDSPPDERVDVNAWLKSVEDFVSMYTQSKKEK